MIPYGKGLGERHILIFTTSNVIVMFGGGGVEALTFLLMQTSVINYKLYTHKKPVNIAQVLILNLHIIYSIYIYFKCTKPLFLS